MEEGEFIFSCSGKKQEKEELRENKSVRRKLLVLNVSSVIGLLCICGLSAFSVLFCGSELRVVQNALQGYIFFPCVFAAYYEIDQRGFVQSLELYLIVAEFAILKTRTIL